MDLDQFRVVADSATASRDEARQLAHAVSVLTARLADQLRALQWEREYAVEAESRALASSRAKSSFLANMSHELRTPLNAIIGYGEMLGEDAEAGARTSYLADLEKIHSAGQHLLSLINDVLDLSKIEAGKMELYLETFDVAELVAGGGRDRRAARRRATGTGW